MTDLLIGTGLASAVFLLTCALAVYLARRILKPRDSDTGMEWKRDG